MDSPKIMQAINTRKFNKNKTSENWETYRKQRNNYFVTSLKRSALKSYCINVSTNTEHPGEFWKKLHCLLPSKDRCNGRIQLIENGRLIILKVLMLPISSTIILFMQNLDLHICLTHGQKSLRLILVS